MHTDWLLKNKKLVTAIATLLIAAHVLWDYSHDGVPTHYVLHDKSLPGISNWWGVLTIPLLTWLCISLSQKRADKSYSNLPNSLIRSPKVINGFLGALFFGIAMSIFWETGLQDILACLIFLPLVLALFIPVHYPEHYLGFVLGMAFTFGGVLPVVFGLIIGIGCFLVYQVLRRGILFFLP